MFFFMRPFIICMCLKPGDVPLFDNTVVIFFSWFYGMRMR